MKSIDTIVIAVGGQGRRIAADLKKREIKTSKIFLELNGKPFLSHLLDMSLALKFRKIFLLSSYHERELQAFLKEIIQLLIRFFRFTGARWEGNGVCRGCCIQLGKN